MSGTVAIVGRPNVGKSTLFNRLVGRRVAMVDKTPGVTRDRREAEARLGDLEFRLVDTAGLGDAASGSLEARMRVQTERALEECSVVLFMIDARAGVTPLDRHFAGWLRRADVPVILIANKTESTRGDAGMLEAFELGLGEPVTISAEHGIGMGLLHEALAPHLRDGEIAADAVAAEEEGEADEEEPGPGAPLSLAIVGRPNVGKSTLINRLLGEERVLTGPEPGLTREAIAVTWSWGEHNIRLIDTAGLRRRARVTDRLEKMSSEDSLVAIRFAQVVVLLLDATDGLERQDLSIARHVADQGRALVVALNKWDLVADEAETLRRVRERLEDSLPQLRGVRLVTLSALTGRGIERLLPAVAETYEIWNRRVSTGPLNRWFEATLERHPPPVVQGRRVRLRYITQIKSRPPTFALFTTRPAALPESYLRYLVNALREAFDLPGVPLRIVTRKGRNPYVEGGSVPSKARRKDAGPRKPRAAI